MRPTSARALPVMLILSLCAWGAPAFADDGPRPASATLRLTSVPLGALVSVDGAPVGHTPILHELSAGRHALRLELSGFRPRDESLQLGPGQLLELELRLSRKTERVAEEPTEKRASALDWLVGGGLVIASLPPLWLGSAALVEDGECVGERDEAGRCSERVVFGTRSAVLLGVGAVALGVGVYVLVARPFGVEVQVSPSGAGLRAQLAF